MHYTIHWTPTHPTFQGQWNCGPWQNAEPLLVDKFHPQSCSHRPRTEAKLLYDDENLYVMFRVRDQYVKATHTTSQDPVCRDSCVEFFVMPCVFNCRKPGDACARDYRGYFNVEINCVGTPLVCYIEDWRRTADGFATYEQVPEDLLQQMSIFHSLPGAKIEEEIQTPIEWFLGYNLPFSMFEAYLGALDLRNTRRWRGNFYKCGDQTSHPHWASWSPIGAELNFHQPQYFGTLEFDE